MTDAACLKGQEERKNEAYDLIRRAQQGEEVAKEELIQNNTGLVRSIAAKFMNTGCEWEDLMQIGFVGLTKAIGRFDISYGNMFSTYAVPMIIGEIRRFLRDDGKIRMPRDTKTGILKMKRVRDEFYKQKGRHPKISELAELLSVSVEATLELLEAEASSTNFTYLDDPENFEQAETSLIYGEDEERKIDMISVKQAISQLEAKERQIIALRYQKDMTQQQVAKIMGTSQVQISRIEKKILEKMRVQIF